MTVWVIRVTFIKYAKVMSILMRLLTEDDKIIVVLLSFLFYLCIKIVQKVQRLLILPLPHMCIAFPVINDNQ